MALLTMLFGGTNTRIDRTIDGKVKKGAIVFDALLSENFSADAEATNFPVENGADITDHVIIKPRKLELNGIVTETPLNLAASLRGASTSAGGALAQKFLGGKQGFASKYAGLGGAAAGGLAGKTMAGIMGSGDKTLANIVTELESIRTDASPITIVTGLKSYPDDENTSMILTSYKVTRDDPTRKIKVSLSFQEVIMVDSENVQVKVPVGGVAHSAGKTKDKAAQTGSTAEKYRSLLKNGVSLVTGGA